MVRKFYGDLAPACEMPRARYQKTRGSRSGALAYPRQMQSTPPRLWALRPPIWNIRRRAPG